jgi:hypothetical protein
MLQKLINYEINPQMSTNDGSLKWWHVPLEGLPQGIGMTIWYNVLQKTFKSLGCSLVLHDKRVAWELQDRTLTWSASSSSLVHIILHKLNKEGG